MCSTNRPPYLLSTFFLLSPSDLRFPTSYFRLTTYYVRFPYVVLPTSYVVLITPYTLHALLSYILHLHPTPYFLHLTSYLRITPYTLHPHPPAYTLHLTYTLGIKPTTHTLLVTPYILHLTLTGPPQVDLAFSGPSYFPRSLRRIRTGKSVSSGYLTTHYYTTIFLLLLHVQVLNIVVTRSDGKADPLMCNYLTTPQVGSQQ